MNLPEYKTFGFGINTYRGWVCYFHFIKFSHLSLGVHISLFDPNIEVHIPFGFVRIGYVRSATPAVRGGER